MQMKIPSWFVCGSHNACLDCMLPGAQATSGLGTFSAFSVLGESENSDSLF